MSRQVLAIRTNSFPIYLLSLLGTSHLPVWLNTCLSPYFTYLPHLLSSLVPYYLPFHQSSYLTTDLLSLLPSYLASTYLLPSYLSSYLLSCLPTFLLFFLLSYLPTYLPSYLLTCTATWLKSSASPVSTISLSLGGVKKKTTIYKSYFTLTSAWKTIANSVIPSHFIFSCCSRQVPVEVLSLSMTSVSLMAPVAK